MIGMTKASVLPEPVTAWVKGRGQESARIDWVASGQGQYGKPTSTTTSRFPMNNGMTLAWTGVIWSNLRSRIRSALSRTKVSASLKAKSDKSNAGGQPPARDRNAHPWCERSLEIGPGSGERRSRRQGRHRYCCRARQGRRIEKVEVGGEEKDPSLKKSERTPCASALVLSRQRPLVSPLNGHQPYVGPCLPVPLRQLLGPVRRERPRFHILHSPVGSGGWSLKAATAARRASPAGRSALLCRRGYR